MWEIQNRTPYAADGIWWRDPQGVHAWLTGIKATFRIHADSTLELEDEQEPLRVSPVWAGKENVPFLLYDADILPLRPTSDVILNGFAYAPGSQPVQVFDARLRLGEIDRTVRVQGPRFWLSKGGAGLHIGPVNDCMRVPLDWAHAVGGYYNAPDSSSHHKLEPRNPCGLAAFGDLGCREGDLLPQVLDPDDSTRPAGLGAIAYHWDPRRHHFGTYDEDWDKQRKPLLPDDWSRISQQCARPDQRSRQYLRGGETVELVNLTPSRHQRFRLPKIGLTCMSMHDGTLIRHRPRIVCVVLEPNHYGDEGRLQIIWNSEIKISTEPDYLEFTRVEERPYFQ